MGEPKPTRVYFFGFTEPGIPPYILSLIKEAEKAKEISVSDWAMIRPNAEGKPEITEDQDVDPGAGRGGLFGGVAGVVLAGISGPIGGAAVVAGAAIGAVTAALRDSGIKDEDLKEIAGQMKEGRSGLVVAVPLEDHQRFDDFTKMHVEFESVIRRVEVDVTPGHSLAQAISEYREQESVASRSS
jgi:uncharacterized membrane protein